MSRKKTYLPTSWSQYNKSLCNKGSLTLWIFDELINTNKNVKKGASKQYSDTAILCANQLKAVYNLTYRATQGFMHHYLSFLGLTYVFVIILLYRVDLKLYTSHTDW